MNRGANKLCAYGAAFPVDWFYFLGNVGLVSMWSLPALTSIEIEFPPERCVSPHSGSPSAVIIDKRCSPLDRSSEISGNLP